MVDCRSGQGRTGQKNAARLREYVEVQGLMVKAKVFE